MNVNKFIKAALKTGLYVLDLSDKATADMRNRMHDGIEDLTDRTKEAIGGPVDHSFRNVVSLAAGVGFGVAVGMLFAPASGKETRSSIAAKVQDAGARVWERFPSEWRRPATGTEG